MMITEAVVTNYKGIKKCEVKDLRRVNLFIGKNDSAKSSILETIFHTCKEFVEVNLQNIMDRRTDVFTGGRELWYRYDTNARILTRLKFGDIGIELDIGMRTGQISTLLRSSVGRATTEFSGTTYVGRDFSYTSGPTRKIERLSGNMPGKKYDELVKYVDGVSFIDCRSKSGISNLEAMLGEIKLSGKDQEFGALLKSIYGKGEEWEFLPHPDSPTEKRMTIKEAGKLTFLSDFGDGLRYGLAMCATAMTSEGTGIFIEEIESHQHPGSLKQLIPSLIEISKKNGLQLFITTHSYDTWNSFVRGGPYLRDVKRRKEEFQCFIVERDIASGKVTAESTDNVQRIVEELGRT